MEDFIKSVIGDYSFGLWLAYFFFAIIGSIAFSWMEVSDRDKASPKTPVKFRLTFFILDNIKRFVATAILIYVQFRFYKELSGNPLNEYTALLIGFGADGLAGFSKKRTKLLQADREKLMKENPEKNTVVP